MLKRSPEMEPLQLVITLYVGLLAVTCATIGLTVRSGLPKWSRGVSIQIIVYNAIALAVTIPFFLHTGPASIRPMGWSLLVGLVTVAGLIGLIRGCLRVDALEARWIALFLVPFVAVTPVFSSGLLMKRAGEYAGFVLSD